MQFKSVYENKTLASITSKQCTDILYCHLLQENDFLKTFNFERETFCEVQLRFPMKKRLVHFTSKVPFQTVRCHQKYFCYAHSFYHL